MDFTQLYEQAEPLLRANVWDAASARAAQAAAHAAIGPFGAAIADVLRYADGEGVSFAELKAGIARLRAISDLPLTMDGEAGYDDTVETVIANLRELTALGVVGVNLEDSVVRNGQRAILHGEIFAQRLRGLKNNPAANARQRLAHNRPLKLNLRLSVPDSTKHSR